MDHHHADDEDITQLRNRSAHHLSYPNFVISHDTPVGTSSPSPTLRARSMYHNSSDHQRRISDGDLILSEDMTTRDRQEAINQNHPFGLRLWKPALYKKPRTIESISYQSVHETPSSASRQSSWFSDWHLYSGNFAWTLLFGWWMAAVFLCVSIAILLPTLAMNKSGRRYSWLMFSMALYIFWPFGLYIERVHAPYDNISSPAVETQPLLSTRTEGSRDRDLAHSLFYQFFYYIIIAPMLLIVSGLCWFLIVSIPVAKLNFVLLGYLNKDPLSLRVSSPILSAIQRQQQQQDNVFSGEILVCVYKAVGLQYLKYTYDGINIVFINLLPAVLFALLDGYFIGPALGHEGVGHPMVVFVLCILSVMPLAYYIGMAVASISSQSSFGFGAVVNASFGSIVEIILYAISITEGKGRLVEGAIIGSFLGTLLLLPGLSMIAGGVGRFKEQRFNVKSASVSTVLLIMALIGAFTPTLFYSVYGSYELQCQQCLDTSNAFPGHKCTGCSYQLPQNPGTDPFYINNVRPLMYLCAAVLPSAYRKCIILV